MSYVLVNSVRLQDAQGAACDIKAKLHQHFNRDVLIVEDFMSETIRGQALFEEIKRPNIRGVRALSIILEQRKALIKEVIIPTVSKGKQVIYVGGVLDDTRYVRTVEFHDILKENQEMLQSLGGFTYPQGAVYVKHPADSPNACRGYFKRVDKLTASMAGLKLANYDYRHATMIKINAMFP